MQRKPGWIGVDLDGTLAEYHGWGDGSIGKPILRMTQRVRGWLAAGYEVRVFTARVGPQPPDVDVAAIAKAIRQWCRENIGVELEVTATKDFGMIELWDDRAVQVVPNTGLRVDRREE